MKRKILFFAFSLLVFLLQTSLPIFFTLPVSLLWAFFLPFFLKEDFAVVLAGILGLLEDLFSERFFGLFLFLSLALCFLAKFLIKKYVKI